MLEICLKENILLLDHVIVTALGLEKKESSLAYAVQKVRGEELNRVKEVNMITALAGKAAGVQVSKNSSGMGGSAKVSIRGVRSVVGDNQPVRDRWCPHAKFYFGTGLFGYRRYGKCR